MSRDWDKICDFENLYQGHQNVKKERKMKSETVRFEQNLAYELATLQARLVTGTYQMKSYFHFEVYEPKRRSIYAAHHIDKILMNTVCEQVLIPRLSPHFIYDNGACQKGKGVHFSIRRFKKHLTDYFCAHGQHGYVLKCDISKYFASIDHDILKQKLVKRIKDPDVTRLLSDLIDTYHTEGHPGVGIPLGNNTSQWFALYYLSDFDHFVKEQLGVRGYVRYMDDFVLIGRSKAELWSCFAQIQMAIGELGLTLNRNCDVFPMRSGVEFLGWRFFVMKSGRIMMRLRTQSKKRYLKKIKILEAKYRTGYYDLQKINRILASHHGHLIHGHAFSLEEQAMMRMALVR